MVNTSNQIRKYKRVYLLFVLGIFSLAGIAQSTQVIAYDNQFSQKETLLDQLPDNVELLELDINENPWKKIREYLISNNLVTTIHLFADTNYNSFQLGGIIYDLEAVGKESEFSMLEGLYTGNNIQLLVYSCNLGSNDEGLKLLKQIGDRAYFNVAIPTNCTSIFGTDLLFDYTSLDQEVPNSIFN